MCILCIHVNEHSCYCHGLTVKNNNQSLLLDWLHLVLLFFSLSLSLSQYLRILFLLLHFFLSFFRLFVVHLHSVDFACFFLVEIMVVFVGDLACFCLSASIYKSSTDRSTILEFIQTMDHFFSLKIMTNLFLFIFLLIKNPSIKIIVNRNMFGDSFFTQSIILRSSPNSMRSKNAATARKSTEKHTNYSLNGIF